MGVPHVTSFCCCLGLEVGAKVIGVLHLLVSLSLVVVASVYAASAHAQVGTVEDAGDGLYTTFYRVAVGAAIVSVVHVLLAATLLASVFNRVTAGLRAWVWIMSALFVAALVAVVVVSALTGLNGSGSDIFLSFLQGLVFFGVVAYAILCVNSYYLMLRSAQDMAGPDKTDY